MHEKETSCCGAPHVECQVSDCTVVTVKLHMVLASMLLGLQQLHCNPTETEEVQHEVML